MKRFFSLVAFALFAMGVSAQAEFAPTATMQVYDLSNYGTKLFDLFYEAEKKGRKYPTQQEFENAGFTMMDMAFVRSHVRPRAIMVDQKKNVNPNAADGRRLWMNTPIGIGALGGYPSSNFSDDTFTGWNYTNVFGAWNHGLFTVPGVAVDAAHKNGTDMYSGTVFFDTTGGRQQGAQKWISLITQKDEKGFKYVHALVNAMMFFGQDGLNYNWEDGLPDQEEVIQFHQACYRYAKECGFNNFHIGLYGPHSLNDSNVRAFYGQGKDRTADLFINYNGGKYLQTPWVIGPSVEAAKKATGSAEGVYAGAWIVTLNHPWENLNMTPSTKEAGIVLWGEHSQSRLMSYNSGISGLDFQENYQREQDRFFSGGHRNPAMRPDNAGKKADWGETLPQFQGFAEYVPERTALKQNLPFTTFFSIGNGDRYNYKGKKTLGSWYNLGQQDVVPTYRWLVYEKGTETPITDNGTNNQGVPEFTNADAYIGGSALRLTNTKAVDIVLYRAELKVSGNNPKATIALKRFEGAPAGVVSVIVKKQGSNTWEETEFANVKGKEWEEQTLKLKGIASGDVIEYVGLRTSGDTKGLLVGELSLNDDSKVVPAEIKEAVVEVKEECQKSLSVRLRWDVVKPASVNRADWDLVYNDEANIDHFEILYKDGEKGAVTEVGRTTSWGAYVGNLPMTAETKPVVGVRAASVDGKTYSSVYWVEVPRYPASQLPEVLNKSGNYPSSILDNSSDGIDNALKQRYVTSFDVANSDGFTKYENKEGTPYTVDIKNGVSKENANKTNYIYAENNVIKCHQGQKLSCTLGFNWKPEGDDGLKWCTAFGYADWDCNEGFDPREREDGSEWVWKCGESNMKHKNADLDANHPITFEVTVPANAKPGNSRLRIVFSDAWFPHPGATGATNKGFTIDFPMVITGDKSIARKAEVDTHDKGVAVEPEGLGVVDGITESKIGVSQVTVDGANLKFENTDKVWIFTANGTLVKHINGGVNSVNVAEFGHGVYLVRMQYGKVMRTMKVVF